MPQFPIYLNLHERVCLVVGGGPVAERKVKSILECEGLVRLVSPLITPALAELYAQNRLSWEARNYLLDDLYNVFLAFICTDDYQLNRSIADDCRNRAIMVNVVDDPSNCDFFVPSVLRRDSLAVAISTEGRSPLFSRRLREELDELIPHDYGQLAEGLGRMRDYIKTLVADTNKRQKVYRLLLQPDILDLIRNSHEEMARERIEACISSWQD